MNPFNIDFKRNFEEALESQKKMISGFETMINVESIDPGVSEKELIYQEDKMRLFRFKPLVRRPLKTPVLIVYALVNRETMMDLEENNSFIRRMLDEGLDVYIIDWGYPTIDDKYLTMDDYIQGYINNAVDIVRERKKVDKLHLLGVCQGGTFSAIYSALNPDKVKNLVTMVAPIDFEPNDALLFSWGKHLPIDKIIDGHQGLVPGNFMNNAFVTLKPLTLNISKYVNLVDNLDDIQAMENFIRMEKWIFDSPDQAGEALRQFVKDLYQDNKLVKGELEIGEDKVDLKKIDMPVLNIYGKYDHIVSPSSSENFQKYTSSKDFENHEIPTGHIGMYVSSRSKDVVAPLIVEWLKARR